LGILSPDRTTTLLAATNSVNTALGGMIMPMVSANPAAQMQLVQ